MKLVPIITMFVLASSLEEDHFHSSEIPHKNCVENKKESIIPAKQYYLLLKMPSKKRRYSNEAHFFVGKPQENNLELEDTLNIYALLNQTENPELNANDSKYVLDKKISDIINLPIMYQLKENSVPDKQELYIFGTPKISWITNGQLRKKKSTAVNELTSAPILSINNPKMSKAFDHDIVIEKPFVSWITNGLPIEFKDTTAKT